MVNPIGKRVIKRILERTQMPVSDISKRTGMPPEKIHGIDYEFGIRDPDFSDTIALERLRQKILIEREKQRTAKALNALSQEMRKKIVSENLPLFIKPVKDFLIKNPWVMERYGLEIRDVINEFVIHCMERMNLFDNSKFKFSTFIYNLFPNFIHNYLRSMERIVSAEKALFKGSQRLRKAKKQKYPRGYGRIPKNLMDVWISLGLSLETAIRFGAGDTRSALSFFSKNAGLGPTSQKVMISLLEGASEQDISRQIGLTAQGVNASKKSAIKKMKKFISEQRKNGNNFAQ